MNFEELWVEREGDFILISLEVRSEMQKTAAEGLGFGNFFLIEISSRDRRLWGKISERQ